MKVVENTTFHTLYSIYIYIYSSVFQHFHIKSANYTKKQTIPRENDGNTCIFSMKRSETKHFAAFTRIFHAFLSVFAEITLFGNDNGEFTRDFVAEQTTHTLHRCKNKSASRNIPPATRLCFEACRVAVFFDFSKKFWYNLYRK